MSAEAILAGRTSLGIELGSTRIKACLIGERPARRCSPSAATSGRTSSSTGVWTYSLEDVWSGIQAAYAELVADVERRYGVRPETFGAIGVSAMMHGYLAFDADGELLVPFRTWRNTTTGPAAAELTELFGDNIPLRWSIAHLHQAVLDEEPHVPEVRFLTTLAGYVHWRLTGRKVLGVGDASGMFPIDSATHDYDAELLARFDGLRRRQRARRCSLAELLPEVLVAGQPAGELTRRGRRAARPVRARCAPASRSARPRATPAPAWSRPTRSPRAPATSAPARASSRWSCSSARSQQRAPRARPRHDPGRRPGRDGALQQRRERARRVGRHVRPLRRGRGHAASTPTPSSTRCSARRSRATRMPAGCWPTTTWPASRSPGSTRAGRCSSARPTAASRSRTSCAPSSTACSAR